jgi:predicted kinase
MPTPPRSVKIGADERGGWSSDRPRREGASGGGPRPVDVGVRGRVLSPTDRLRYMPGSMVAIVSGSRSARDTFADRVVEDKAAIISRDKVRALLAGRVAEEEMDERVDQLLDAAIAKRLGAKQSVVLLADGADAAERDRVIRIAHANRAPRHLVLIEAPRDEIDEDALEPLNALRRALDAGELGQEGWHTALRLGGGTIAELKRLVFRPPPEDE